MIPFPVNPGVVGRVGGIVLVIVGSVFLYFAIRDFIRGIKK